MLGVKKHHLSCDHYPCSDDSLRTDALPGSKQHVSPDQRQDNQLTTTRPENSPDQHQQCVGPWPGYPECAGKMEVCNDEVIVCVHCLV